MYVQYTVCPSKLRSWPFAIENFEIQRFIYFS